MNELTKLNSTEELIADLALGRPVILMDDEGRENEGDLVVVAERINPELINFMITECRGLVCLTISEDKANSLNLRPQTQHNTAQYSTAFTVSIEAAEGVSTGISAFDRAKTILAAVNKNAKPSDLVQPGHIFPITSKNGGVLVRAGHTEASVDLARLAGFEAAGVICEIIKDDGSMARRPDLELFAQKHNLKIGTIADLIAYRLAREKSIKRVSSCELPTKYGNFRLTAYQSIFSDTLHYALVKGEIKPEESTFVRVQVKNNLSDLFGANLPEKNYSLDEALQALSRENSGVLVVLDAEEKPEVIIKRMEQFSSGENPQKLRADQEIRTYGVGAQILLDQNVRSMRLMSEPYKLSSISGYQLEIKEFLNNQIKVKDE